MQRRRYLATVGTCLAGTALSGCLDRLPGEGNDPRYPGGTLVVENTGDSVVRVSVTAEPAADDGALDASVAGGETVVRREFVIGEPGDAVTLEARLGSTGDPIAFEFLPAGGEGDAPPEVARLAFENAVEASATWTATAGTPRRE